MTEETSRSLACSFQGVLIGRVYLEALRGVLYILQGRAGEALSFELAKCLERTLNAHSSGRGAPLAEPA